MTLVQWQAAERVWLLAQRLECPSKDNEADQQGDLGGRVRCNAGKDQQQDSKDSRNHFGTSFGRESDDATDAASFGGYQVSRAVPGGFGLARPAARRLLFSQLPRPAPELRAWTDEQHVKHKHSGQEHDRSGHRRRGIRRQAKLPHPSRQAAVKLREEALKILCRGDQPGVGLLP